jgi:hypothetical protein
VTGGLLVRGLGWALLIASPAGCCPPIRAARLPVTVALRTAWPSVAEADSVHEVEARIAGVAAGPRTVRQERVRAVRRQSVHANSGLRRLSRRGHAGIYDAASQRGEGVGIVDDQRGTDRSLRPTARS